MNEQPDLPQYGTPPSAAAAEPPLPPSVIPVRYPLPPSRRSLPAAPVVAGSNSWLRWLLMTGLTIAIGLGLAFYMTRNLGFGAGSGSVEERFHSGDPMGVDKIAVIRIEGVLMEGMTAYAEKQIEAAAKDPRVKAVVVRINSPGGSITTSDDLHRRLSELHENQASKKDAKKKPLVVSMGAMAASGGYYIAMPAQHIVAERTTITGSIGVYAAFPNIAELAGKHGVSMNVIKAGAIKDSGSMFHPMTAQERELWQGMVDNAYNQFLKVVEEGRSSLTREVMLKPIPEEEKLIPDRGPDGKVVLDAAGKEKRVPFSRYRADGGIFTAEQAKTYGLIDSIGYLQDAIKAAQAAANLNDEYKVVVYDKPATFFSNLLGGQAPNGSAALDPQKLAAGAEPRLWFLAPQAELAGFLAAVSRP